MKRTAATFVMLAGLGGGCTTADKADGPAPFGQVSVGKEVPGVMGPDGGPVQRAAAQMPSGPDGGVTHADHTASPGAATGIRQTAGFARVSSGGGHVHGAGCADGSCGAVGGVGASAMGPMGRGLGYMIGHGPGVLPVPAMGPPGAVAAVGALNAPGSGMYGAMYQNQRTSIRFANPAGMTISWLGPNGEFTDNAALTAPVVYNFPQANVYRLKLTGIPNRPGARPLYPTLEVYPTTPNTLTYLSHNSVPVSFTNDDFEQVASGNLVVKVIYLPHERFQDLAAVAGADEVVSTRLEPGVNPIEEANRRGTILAVIRVGNIDLQDPNTPAMDAPPGGLPGMAPPGGLPGMAPSSGITPPRMMTPPPAAATPVPATLPAITIPATPVAPPAPTAEKESRTGDRLINLLPSLK